jgi:hypothetical protein
MTSVTHSLAADAAVLAANLNTNFADAVSLATAVGNEQITGGLTYDKLADRFALSWICVPVVPIGSDESLETPADYTIPTAGYDPVAYFPPVMQAGAEGFLCAVTANCVAMGVISTSSPSIRIYLNGTILLGTLNLTGAGAALTARLGHPSDAIANPICSMSDGDYLEIQYGPDQGSGAATVRGLNVYLAVKYQLVA